MQSTILQDYIFVTTLSLLHHVLIVFELSSIDHWFNHMFVGAIIDISVDNC